MRLSFNDEESFREAVGSLDFNNPPSDPNSLQEVASSSTMPAQEMNEDICFDNPSPSSSRVPVGSSSSSGPSGSTSLQERSGDIGILANYGIIATTLTATWNFEQYRDLPSGIL